MLRTTVLVVDDEALIRWSIGERLPAEGYDVLEASDGRTAVDLFGRSVHIVLLDSKLPDVDAAPCCDISSNATRTLESF